MYGTTGSPTQVWNTLNGGKTGAFARDRSRDLLPLYSEPGAQTAVTPAKPATGALTEYLEELERSGLSFGSGSSSSSSSGQPNPFSGAVAQSSTKGLGLPGWLATGAGQAVRMGGGYAGLSPYITGPLGAIAQGIASDGDVNGMLKRGGASVAATGANQLLPGYGAQLLGLGASALRGDSLDDGLETAGNMAISKVASLAVPGIGPVLGVLGAFGFNPVRGLKNTFSPDTTKPESWRGGFFDPGYKTEKGSYITSGNENFSPYGGAQYDRVPDAKPPVIALPSSSYSGSSSSVDRHTPGNSTYFGGLNTGGGNNYQSSNSGSSSSYSGGSSYSNPASSYGGW